MSRVNFLEKLLDGVTVEWLPLSDFSSVLRGKRLTKSQLSEDADFPVYHGGLDPLGSYTEFNRPANTVMIINVGASAGTVGYSFTKFWSSDGCYCLKQNSLINDRYLYFSLIGFQDFLRSRVRVAGIPTLDAKVINSIKIPVPCPDNPKKSLEIQAEIVRILDAMTAHTAELTAELTARKKQYNYYRDKLLSFEDGDVEWKPLGEVCDFKNGFAFKSNLFRDKGLPIVRITNISGSIVDMTDAKYFNPSDYKENIENYVIEKDDILIAMSGATTGKIGCFDKNYPAYLNQRVGKFVPKIKYLNNRYLYHFLLSKTEQIYFLAGGGAQPNLSSKALMEKIEIPIPYAGDTVKSNSEQKRIAGILDKLDKLINSISEGLPREIELREKQYAYYRDLLLSFPKPPTI